MSYPGPPGVSRTASHPSLPPRPPAAKPGGFKPAFSAAPVVAQAAPSPGGYPPPAAPSYSSAPSYRPPVAAAAPSSYGVAASAAPYAASNPAPSAIGRGGYNRGNTFGGYPQQSYAQQPSAYYGAPGAAAVPGMPAGAGSYSSATPQIRNPFPAPNAHVGPAATAAAANDYDPEMAAQIAQWQSAYMPKDPNDPTSKAAAPNGRPGAAATTESADSSAPAATGDEKKKTVYREGGGKKWQDDTLLEWDPSHLRLFVGNLAGETTDDSLLKAFARWKSVQKAKVVRDKRTTKSKGFGFVSFSDPEDFFQAAKEMNGKYIQSHPVVVRKAKTEIKPQAVKEDRRGGKHKRGGGHNDKKSGSGMGAGAGGNGGAGHHQDGSAASAPYEPYLGPTGGGVTKPGQKTRGGLKLLG